MCIGCFHHICVLPHRIVANIRKFVEYGYILCNIALISFSACCPVDYRYHFRTGNSVIAFECSVSVTIEPACVFCVGNIGICPIVACNISVFYGVTAFLDIIKQCVKAYRHSNKFRTANIIIRLRESLSAPTKAARISVLPGRRSESAISEINSSVIMVSIFLRPQREDERIFSLRPAVHSDSNRRGPLYISTYRVFRT